MLKFEDVWNNKMRTGIDLIDEHHKVLVSMLVDVRNALETSNERRRIGPVVDRLISYSRYHFRAEERLMIEHKYPLIDEHREEHRLYIDRMTRGFMTMSGIDGALALELFEFLKGWLVHHILKKDMDFAEYVRTRSEEETSERTKAGDPMPAKSSGEGDK